ncbi:hypothetical protein ACFE04_011131 [Oxalis oulophora]
MSHSGLVVPQKNNSYSRINPILTPAKRRELTLTPGITLIGTTRAKWGGWGHGVYAENRLPEMVSSDNNIQMYEYNGVCNKDWSKNWLKKKRCSGEIPPEGASKEPLRSLERAFAKLQRSLKGTLEKPQEPQNIPKEASKELSRDSVEHQRSPQASRSVKKPLRNLRRAREDPCLKNALEELQISPPGASMVL